MEKTKVKAAFQPVGLRLVGSGVWVYRHEGDKPESLPTDFWKPAQQNYGMRDGDLVFLVCGKQADMVVV